jgi:hypothetical protein
MISMGKLRLQAKFRGVMSGLFTRPRALVGLCLTSLVKRCYSEFIRHFFSLPTMLKQDSNDSDRSSFMDRPMHGTEQFSIVYPMVTEVYKEFPGHGFYWGEIL